MVTKHCSKCKQIKPLSEFYNDRSKKDGHRSWCKSCVKADQQSEKGKAVARKRKAKYRQTPRGSAYQKAYQQSDKGKAVLRKSIAKRNAYNPNYAKAKDAVSNAIAAGRLPRANTRLCFYCQKPARQYHHWHGYEPECWLDVVPACIECHRKCHSKCNYRENEK